MLSKSKMKKIESEKTCKKMSQKQHSLISVRTLRRITIYGDMYQKDITLQTVKLDTVKTCT